MDRKCFNFPHMCLVEDGKFALNKFSIIPLLHKKMIEKIVIIRDKIVNSLYKTFSLHLFFPSLGGWFCFGLGGKFHPPLFHPSSFPSHQTFSILPHFHHTKQWRTPIFHSTKWTINVIMLGCPMGIQSEARPVVISR